MREVDYTKPPSRKPWTTWGRWWWFAKSGDEWGRHTLVVPIVPGVLGLVVPVEACDCDDMDEFTCTTPGCPWKSIGAGNPCMLHDEVWHAFEADEKRREEQR